MSINRIISAGIMLGFLLGGGSAMAQEPSMLTGGGRFGVTLESSFSSREVKIDDAKERLRVIRQAIRVSYGLADWIDIYIKGGPGRIEFQKLDLSSKTRPAFGGGIRLLGATKKGYFAGFSFQHQTGTVSKFSSGDQSFSLEDDWTEQDVLLFTGTKDLISGPQFNGRIYTGLRFS
ncbi:MAG TPA: hypothetical protein VIU33_06685, partial [Nitrospiria bacterium]